MAQSVKIGLYADGDYMCKCTNCEKAFQGDKRAIHCFRCAALIHITDLEQQLAAARLAGKIEGLEEALKAVDEVEYEWGNNLDGGSDVLSPSDTIRARIAELQATTTPASAGSSESA